MSLHKSLEAGLKHFVIYWFFWGTLNVNWYITWSFASAGGSGRGARFWDWKAGEEEAFDVYSSHYVISEMKLLSSHSDSGEFILLQL